MAGGADELTVHVVDAWSAWLAQHVTEQAGVWLLVSRKGAPSSRTTLTDAQALEGALCQGALRAQSGLQAGRGPCRAGHHIEVPADLAAALADRPGLPEVFASLNAKDRCAVLHRVTTAVRPTTRAARIEKYADMLASGQTPCPQATPLQG